MSITKRLGLLGTLAVALVTGLAACQTSGTMTSLVTDKGENFASWLAKPEGEGPFPAVVLTHGCSGTERNTSHQTVWRGLNGHAALLNDYGYVTLIVDSFGARRITDGCQTGGKYYSLQVSDAHAAFDHLASLPFVDADRIGFVGQSLGGGTALRLALGSTVDSRTREGEGSYVALVAYYPWCEAAWAYALKRPVMILNRRGRRLDACVAMYRHALACRGCGVSTRFGAGGLSGRAPFLRPSHAGALLRGGHERPLPYGARKQQRAAGFRRRACLPSSRNTLAGRIRPRPARASTPRATPASGTCCAPPSHSRSSPRAANPLRLRPPARACLQPNRRMTR